MAKAVQREKPFTGEVIRLYEEDKHKPGKAARTALAAVFDRDEFYIEFGESGRVIITSSRAAHTNKRATEQTAREQILLHLFSGLFKLQQRELIDEMHALYRANEITRKELGQQPLRGVSNAQIEAAFGATPIPIRKKKPTKKHNGDRDPGAAMGDYLDLD